MSKSILAVFALTSLLTACAQTGAIQEGRAPASISSLPTAPLVQAWAKPACSVRVMDQAEHSGHASGAEVYIGGALMQSFRSAAAPENGGGGALQRAQDFCRSTAKVGDCSDACGG